MAFRLGLLTCGAVAAGMAVFLIFTVLGRPEEAVLAILYTPLAAAAVTGIELLIRRLVWPGISLLCAVILIVVSLLAGVSL